MSIRILIVGDGSSEIHEAALSKAFSILGCDVTNFFTSKYFSFDSRYLSLVHKIQNKFHFGPLIFNINKKIIQCVEEGNYDLVFFYRGINVFSDTILKIRGISKKTKLVCYNNDNPFSSDYPRWEWRHYIRCISLFDVVCVYRPDDVKLAQNHGAREVRLLRSWYIPWLDVPPKEITDGDIKKYKSDVVFAGHYESDGRLKALENLLSSGVDLKVFGPYQGLGKSGWANKISTGSPLSKVAPFEYLAGEEYRKAIFLSDIALCFLSKLNRDTYTRRCFEIPAIGGVLFSEYSADLASIYEDGVEAVFFKSEDELLSKVKYYLSHPDDLKKVKEKGYQAVKNNRHDVINRARGLLDIIC